MDHIRLHTRRSALQWMAAGAAAPLGLSAANAAEFPDRPIKLINPTIVGSTVDSVARILAEKMGRHLGKPVLVESKPGASGAIGASFVAQGPKEGYAIYFGTSSSLGYMKMANRELPYEPVSDFSPVAMVGSVPVCLFTNPALGINTIEEFVAAAKAKPGQFSFATNGPLTLTHLAGEMLSQRAGISMVHVPYAGSAAQYWADMLGGQLQLVIAGASGGLPLARDGRIKLLAVASRERSRLLPDVPALGEVFPGLDVPAWFGLAVAAGTPAPVVRKLEEAALAALREPSTRPAFATIGVELDALGSRAFAAKIAADNQMWEKTLKSAGLFK